MIAEPTRPRWLDEVFIGRAVWIVITLLTIALMAAGVPLRFTQLVDKIQSDQLTLHQLGITPGGYARYLISLDLIVVAFHLAIAWAIFRLCRSDRRTALLVQFALVTNGALIPLARAYSPASQPNPINPLVNLVIFTGLITSTALLFLFPDGRFVPRWTAVLISVMAGGTLYGLLFPDSPLSFVNWSLLLQAPALLIISGAGAYAQLYRYINVSNPLRRQQTKWAALGLFASVIGPLAYYLPFVILPSFTRPSAAPNVLRNLLGQSFFGLSLQVQLVGAAIFSLLLLLFPLTFAIAILRYRLWDIDVIIRRTLVYGVVTGLLGLLYYVSVVLLQNLFSALSGQRSAVVIVISTLTIAALFSPLRNRVQDFVDKRFYRHKYNAEKILARFAAAARDEVDMDRLAAALLDAVEQTMQPQQAGLWLRSTPGGPGLSTALDRET